MSSKIILFLSSILLLIVTFERIKSNTVFKFHFKYEIKENEVAEQLVFRDYLKKFNKSYGRGEFEMRYHNFKENLHKIETLNRGARHATYGVTKFSDWTKDELAAMLLPKGPGRCDPRNMRCPSRFRDISKNKRRLACCKKRGSYAVSNVTSLLKESNVNILWREEKCRCGSRQSRVIRNQRILKLPPKVDWRETGAVGLILDQKQCAVCWAFSIIGVMESRAFINNHSFNRLSIQELMDCSFYNEHSKTGCHRGRAIVHALGYMCKERFRVTTEANYPLTLVEEKCHKTAPGLRRISHFVNDCDMYLDEKKLLKELTNGPVVALVNARLLLNYNEGIIAENCQTTVDELNHAVQIVGYVATGEIPYYILRNSWGSDWGEQGYAKLGIGGNQCGVAFSIAYFDVD